MPLGVYSFAVVLFSVCITLELLVSLVYLASEWRKGSEENIAVCSFSFCVDDESEGNIARAAISIILPRNNFFARKIRFF